MSDAKVALVTGSSSGIGEATVELLSKEGYKVVVTGSRKEKVERVAKRCAELSPKKFEPLALVIDLNDPKSGESLVQKTIQHYGRLDVLVNNAGMFSRTCSDDADSYDAYRRVMTVNIDAAVKITLASVEHLKQTKGDIVFVSSVSSVKPQERSYAYCMSKASMSMFAKCLAVDLSPDIRVNIISPGPVVTPIFDIVGIKTEQVEPLLGPTTLLNRVGQSEEIAAAVLFLISDKVRYLNGHEMFIDGGYMINPTIGSVAKRIISARADS